MSLHIRDHHSGPRPVRVTLLHAFSPSMGQSTQIHRDNTVKWQGFVFQPPYNDYIDTTLPQYNVRQAFGLSTNTAAAAALCAPWMCAQFGEFDGHEHEH
jgi:hypothetical protein